MFRQEMEDTEKTEILKDVLMDGNKVKSRNLDNVRTLFNKKVAADHLRRSAYSNWKEAEEHKSTSTEKLQEAVKEVEGYVEHSA